MTRAGGIAATLAVSIAAPLLLMHQAPAPRPLLELRYTTQQPRCTRAQTGELARMVDGPRRLILRCAAVGPAMHAWEVING